MWWGDAKIPFVCRKRGEGVPPPSQTRIVRFVRRKMGEGPLHSPRRQTLRSAAAASTRSPRRRVKATVRTRGLSHVLAIRTTALVMYASVRPVCWWGTDLFSPLILHAFLPVRWRMAVGPRMTTLRLAEKYV
jgi:hypothetical protein